MMSKVIGIDISKASFDVAFLDEGKWQHFVFSNDVTGFKLFAKRVKYAHCVMEASGPYYLKLAMFLESHGFKVSVVNPLIIKRFSQMRLLRAKTDKKDAQTIAEYGEREKPSIWKPVEETVLRLQQHQTALQNLEKQETMIQNQLEAFISSGVTDGQVIKSLKKIKATLDREIMRLEVSMEQLVMHHYKDTYQRLTSIPGVGKKTAIMLIALTNNFKKFENYKQLIAYVGFSPRIFQSGTSVRGKGHICKMGKSQIRKLLYMCSWSAKRYNQSCVQMYERLKAKGKPERVIKIAIANKLLKQAFAIAKSNSFYKEDFQTKPCF